ncbi:MAG: TIGR03619 family F420-dependent LLM class oxidoreductase [Myxococcota bacterium]
MKFWISLSHTATEHVVRLAQRAESVGFEGVSLADHMFVPEVIESKYPYSPDGSPPFAKTIHHPDVWALISAMATATKTLRFTLTTYILPLHDVFETARGAATAAVLSQGRAHISVGVGWMKDEFDIRGIDWKSRGRRTDEMIEVMRKLWSGEPTEHHGDFYDFRPLTMRPAPPGPIPILVGGSSPPALRRSATLGDGWIGHGHTPDETEALLDEIARLRAEAGRSAEPFECMVPLATEPDAGDYERLAKKGMDAVVSFPPSVMMGNANPTFEEELAFIDAYAENVIRPFASIGE